MPFQHPHRIFKREKGSEKEKTVPEPTTSTKISSKRPQKKLNTGIQLLSATPWLPQEKMEWQASHFSPWKSGYECEIKRQPPLSSLKLRPQYLNKNQQHRTLYWLAILSIEFILHLPLKKSYPLNRQHRTLYWLAILSMKFFPYFAAFKMPPQNRQQHTLYFWPQ